MPDYFALLGQERRPWLDVATLKDAFHRRSAELHPDVAGTGDEAAFADLNRAYSVLSEPASRLRHLLELTAPESLATNAPPPSALGDLFMRFGSLKQRSAALAAKQAAATSPLSQALLADEAATLRRDIEALVRDLDAAFSQCLHFLIGVDTCWQEIPAANLAAVYQRLAYLTRWREQAWEVLLQRMQ